jgi:hypothetical protein
MHIEAAAVNITVTFIDRLVIYIQNQGNENKVNDFSIKHNNKRGPMYA